MERGVCSCPRTMSEQAGNQKIKRIIKAALGEFRIELTIVVVVVDLLTPD